jgi:hypothetical protein
MSSVDPDEAQSHNDYSYTDDNIEIISVPSSGLSTSESTPKAGIIKDTEKIVQNDTINLSPSESI